MLDKIKILAPILLVFFAFPAHAQDDSPKMTDVIKGEKAPFTGTLLNPPAIAQIVADKENVQTQCSLTKAYIEDKEKTRCDLLLNTAIASLETLQQKHSTILDIKAEEIERLNKIALQKPNQYNHWWFAGGMIAGITTSIVIFYAAVETAK